MPLVALQVEGRTEDGCRDMSRGSIITRAPFTSLFRYSVACEL